MKYEYKVIRFEDADGDDVGSIEAELCELGRDGWENYAVWPTTYRWSGGAEYYGTDKDYTSLALVCFLRRPLAEETPR